MPPEFYFPSRDVQMWTAADLPGPGLRESDEHLYSTASAGSNPTSTFEQARAELEVIADRLARDYPETNEETGISFFRMHDNMSPRFRLMLIALGGASLCLLLLTCANLANLLLARAAARERELAVRAALGAGRERLVRQLITESVALTLLGGAAGVAVAIAGVPLFRQPRSGHAPNRHAAGAGSARCIACGAVHGAHRRWGSACFPAIRAGRRTGFGALREGAAPAAVPSSGSAPCW